MYANTYNSRYGTWTLNRYQPLQQSTANRWAQIRREDTYGKGSGISSSYGPSGSSRTFYGYQSQSSLGSAPRGYSWSLGRSNYGAVTYNLTPNRYSGYSSYSQRDQIIANYQTYGSPSPYRSTNSVTSRYGVTSLGTFSGGKYNIPRNLNASRNFNASRKPAYARPPARAADAYGTDGNDTLIGSSGRTQVLVGGKGDDTYIINSAFHTVRENQGEGEDTVILSVAGHAGLAVFQNVENLTLSGAANNGVGNDLDNKIIGNGFNNYLDGKAGADTLTGGQGADVFAFSTTPVFDGSAVDHITDFNSLEGDSIRVTRSAFGINGTDKLSRVKTVYTQTELDDALSSDSVFVYHQPPGDLYFNQDGALQGAGSGGVFAVLDNQSSINTVNII